MDATLAIDAESAPGALASPGARAAVHRRPVLLYVVAGLVALLLVWRVVVVNVSAMFALEAETNPAAAASALAWNDGAGEALLRLADSLVERDPARARELAVRALGANPASARAYLVLARLAAASGDTRAYAAALARSSELEPQNAPTRLALAELAMRQNDAASALVNFDAAIRARPSLAPELHPQLMALLATGDGEAALRKLLARRIPAWWPAFFAYAAANADAVIVPLRLLDIRRSFDPTPGVAERQPVVERLAKEGEWQPAFFVWLNGLTPEQRRSAGNVHNGSFEMPFTTTAFDWRWPARNGVEVEALPTFGTTGARALRLAFQGQVPVPRLVSQTVLLDPGFAYELRGRYRLESLRTPFGVQWEMSCGANGSPTALGAGERLVGTVDWRDFAVRFAVPPDCYPQQVSLHLRGDAKLDLQATGLAWFDDIQIIRGAAVANVRPASASSASTVSPASAGGETGSHRNDSRSRESR